MLLIPDQPSNEIPTLLFAPPPRPAPLALSAALPLSLPRVQFGFGFQLVGILEDLLAVTASSAGAPVEVEAVSARLTHMSKVKANYRP